jgi:hypothetical protein
MRTARLQNKLLAGEARSSRREVPHSIMARIDAAKKFA